MAWVKSSKCESNACLEAAYYPAQGKVYIRQRVNGMVSNSVSVTLAEWDAFADGVKVGDFDRLMVEPEEVPPGW